MKTHLIHGTKQGAINSPHVWLFVSSTPFDVLESEANGEEFISLDDKQKIELYILSFFDDTKNQVNHFD